MSGTGEHPGEEQAGAEALQEIDRLRLAAFNLVDAENFFLHAQDAYEGQLQLAESQIGEAVVALTDEEGRIDGPKLGEALGLYEAYLGTMSDVVNQKRLAHLIELNSANVPDGEPWVVLAYDEDRGGGLHRPRGQRTEVVSSTGPVQARLLNGDSRLALPALEVSMGDKYVDAGTRRLATIHVRRQQSQIASDDLLGQHVLRTGLVRKAEPVEDDHWTVKRRRTLLALGYEDISRMIGEISPSKYRASALIGLSSKLRLDSTRLTLPEGLLGLTPNERDSIRDSMFNSSIKTLTGIAKKAADPTRELRFDPRSIEVFAARAVLHVRASGQPMSEVMAVFYRHARAETSNARDALWSITDEHSRHARMVEAQEGFLGAVAQAIEDHLRDDELDLEAPGAEQQ